jgi:hypothetical protein
MTPREFVLARYPNAVAQRDILLKADAWFVYADAQVFSHTLGNGCTEEEAWRAAATKVNGERATDFFVVNSMFSHVVFFTL